MNIAQIKQIGIVDSWVDFAGQIIEIKESKNRTKKNRLMTKIKVKDEADEIGAWVYTDNSQCTPNQIINANGMLKEYEGRKYIDYATIKNSQQAPPQPSQAPQQASQPKKVERNGRDVSIERQAAFKAACDAWDTAKPEDIIALAIAGHYFIETGNDFYKIPEPDESITEQPEASTESGSVEDDIPF